MSKKLIRAFVKSQQNMASSMSMSTSTSYRQLIFLFGLVYFAQGISLLGGPAGQPIQYYLKETAGLGPAQVTELLAIATIPWMLKPLYGLLSDFVPILGYRRKSWLLIANIVAAIGFIWLSGLHELEIILIALVLTSLCFAVSDVTVDALMVETGNRTGATAKFQSAQWFCVKLGTIASLLVGGYLCAILSPLAALHTAALIVVIAPLLVIVASWVIVHEERVGLDLNHLKVTAGAVRSALQAPGLRIAVVFIVVYCLRPSYATPWYYHQVNTLTFSQDFIGVVGACSSVSSLAGAAAYWRFLSDRRLSFQLSVGIWLSFGSILTYFFQLAPSDNSRFVAIAAASVEGAIDMIILLAILTLAAKACPVRAEGFTFAGIAAAMNVTTTIGAIIGARLVSDVFGSLGPSLLLSGVYLLGCLLLVPAVRAGESRVT